MCNEAWDKILSIISRRTLDGILKMKIAHAKFQYYFYGAQSVHWITSTVVTVVI